MYKIRIHWIFFLGKKHFNADLEELFVLHLIKDNKGRNF